MITPMSPKTRFQVMLEPEQLEALRRIEREKDVPVARLIRRAIDQLLESEQAQKAERRRASTRKRP